MNGCHHHNHEDQLEKTKNDILMVAMVGAEESALVKELDQRDIEFKTIDLSDLNQPPSSGPVPASESTRRIIFFVQRENIDSDRKGYGFIIDMSSEKKIIHVHMETFYTSP